MEGYEVIRETERNGRLQNKDGKEKKSGRRRGENTKISRMGKRGRNEQRKKERVNKMNAGKDTRFAGR